MAERDLCGVYSCVSLVSKKNLHSNLSSQEVAAAFMGQLEVAPTFDL